MPSRSGAVLPYDVTTPLCSFSQVKYLENSIAVRNRVIDTLEEASRVSDPEIRGTLLTFVIVGGGAGVENAGAMAQVDGQNHSGIGRFSGDWIIREFTRDHSITVKQKQQFRYPF